jgi:hypothetical protein
MRLSLKLQENKIWRQKSAIKRGRARSIPHRLLLHKRYDAAQKLHVDLAQLNAVERDFARQRFVQAQQQRHHGGLAAARRAHDAGQLFGGKSEIQPLENGLVRSRRVQKRHLQNMRTQSSRQNHVEWLGAHIVELKLSLDVFQREPRAERRLQRQHQQQGRRWQRRKTKIKIHLSAESSLPEEQHVDAAGQLQRFQELPAKCVNYETFRGIECTLSAQRT